jgi:DNA (cytosine-5)-methyltransferase 1
MIRLCELFAGVGAQRMALDRLGVPYRSVGISEISKPAVRAYEAVHGDCDNLGDITKMETLPDCDLLTYSFPCQDLSVAGRQAGMERESHTRSSLLWEVERLLRSADKRPGVLIMETVTQVHSAKNQNAWRSWLSSLEEMGYTNSWADLNAVDYGVPQNRNRCFMVSRLDGYRWVPPRPIPLTRCLRDIMEPEADRRYYVLPDRMMTLLRHLARNRARGNGFGISVTDPSGPSKTVTTRTREEDETIIPACHEAGMLDKETGMIESMRRVYFADGASPTINAGGQRESRAVKVVEGPVQVGEMDRTGGFTVYDSKRRVWSADGASPTIVAHTGKDITDSPAVMMGDGTGPALDTMIVPKTVDDVPPEFRVRRLTPREMWRLMDFYGPDGHEYYDDLKDYDPHTGVSLNQRAVIAGNSIVVAVLEAVMRNIYSPDASIATLDRWSA